MKVKAIVDFFDVLDEVPRKAGEVFEVSDDRYESLSKREGAMVLVEIVEDKPKKPKK